MQFLLQRFRHNGKRGAGTRGERRGNPRREEREPEDGKREAREPEDGKREVREPEDGKKEAREPKERGAGTRGERRGNPRWERERHGNPTTGRERRGNPRLPLGKFSVLSACSFSQTTLLQCQLQNECRLSVSLSFSLSLSHPSLFSLSPLCHTQATQRNSLANLQPQRKWLFPASKRGLFSDVNCFIFVFGGFVHCFEFGDNRAKIK